jgi:hypothetical protein
MSTIVHLHVEVVVDATEEERAYARKEFVPTEHEPLPDDDWIDEYLAMEYINCPTVHSITVIDAP